MYAQAATHHAYIEGREGERFEEIWYLRFSTQRDILIPGGREGGTTALLPEV